MDIGWIHLVGGNLNLCTEMQEPWRCYLVHEIGICGLFPVLYVLFFTLQWSSSLLCMKRGISVFFGPTNVYGLVQSMMCFKCSSYCEFLIILSGTMFWFQRRRKIEAINGAWAMIGLTAGLVIEGQTGKSILMQVNFTLLLCVHVSGLSLSLSLSLSWRE